MLVSGVNVSSAASRLRFFGNTPAAARNVLEDLGLVVFVAIVGINAGNSLLEQLTGVLALKIFLIGFVACSVPPVIVWCIGLYIFRFNPAILMGGVAGARTTPSPAASRRTRSRSQTCPGSLPGGLASRSCCSPLRLLRHGPRAVRGAACTAAGSRRPCPGRRGLALPCARPGMGARRR